MEDLLYSSLTTFCQAILAFTNANTLQTPDSCTCLTLHLIRGMAPNSLVFGLFFSHDRSFALTERQAAQKGFAVNCI